jgi:DNA processing protein
MNEHQRGELLPTACEHCLRRSWLLRALSVPLDYCAPDRRRLRELLCLHDRDLLHALGGRRRDEVNARYEDFQPSMLPHLDGTRTFCRHSSLYPPALLELPSAPALLNMAGDWQLLQAAEPMVAIVGSRRASDYGLAMASDLARGLAASGVTVVSALADGIAAAALAGALEREGSALAVMGGGLSVGCPATKRSLHGRLLLRGCAISELPHDCPGRRWGTVAGERIIAALANVVVVVEAEAKPQDIALAGSAAELGRTVGAMPGRVTSPLSAGTNSLLLEGASVVRHAEDVLELLYQLDARSRAPREAAEQLEQPPSRLEPRLARVLHRVGTGCDTLESLTPGGDGDAEVLLALSELEIMGLLIRGEGGRYLPCQPLGR